MNTISNKLPIIVLKYGGSSIATTDNLVAVARQVIRCKASGEDPVVVVSAMGETTDHFLTMVDQITDHPGARELDMLLSVGERISIALLAMAINSEGPYEAVSLTGSQVGIITDTNHTRARIVEIRCARIHQVLEKGQIPIVAGFQGVSVEKEITTLGRGGSDTTAVALAASLGAVQCRILKDVDGVYTADPREVPNARIINQVDYTEMLEFSATGSKVIAADAVTLARQHNVDIGVGRTDTGAVGTIITSGDFTKGGVRGLNALRDLGAIKLGRQSDLSSSLSDLHAEGVIIRSLHSESTRPVILIDKKYVEPGGVYTDTLLSTEWGSRAYLYRRTFGRISAIGSGLEPGGKYFARLQAIIEENKITPRWYCCSSVRVSFCIIDSRVNELLYRLHHGLIES
ncbi:aspartate kinase [candidate division LCP-89 bacterium B3_LCP]|uniref:Aspartokinase n=1 Tax=candidate division LCP-89 bacterium B3_LCP TaxID=2012998 RepID=A0A532URL8_UNCL8|nr:MAG: aspartate kinase [candidate division LCP-89 bacterium B3_LCP]